MGIDATVRLGSSIATPQTLQQILIVGSSTSFGAASTGNTSPKWLNSWPGQMRTALDAVYGAAGTGIVIANNDVSSNMSWDGRFTFGGTVTPITTLGWHRDGLWRTTSGSGNYIEFTATGTTAYVTCLAKSAGLGRVSVDGGTSQTFRVMATGGTTPQIEKLPGYHAGHVVIPVSLGALGEHTIRVWGEGTDLDFVSIDVRTGAGSFLVSNVSMNGKSMTTLVTSDETNGTYGLPLLDTAMKGLPGPVLFVIASNEWTGASGSTSGVQAHMDTLTARTLAAGRVPKFAVTPQPNPTLQGGSMTYTQMCDAMQSKATALGVGFLNLQKLWSTPGETNETTMYNDGVARGYFADTIHPDDDGAETIEAAFRSFLGV